MSVLVKGMKMPYGCANCSFVSEPIYDVNGRAIYCCKAPVEDIRGKDTTDQVIAMYDGAGESFPDWCPLVEVPVPHGRLIDADALADKWIWGNTDRTRNVECIELHDLEDSPTVIEEEGE